MKNSNVIQLPLAQNFINSANSVHVLTTDAVKSSGQIQVTGDRIMIGEPVTPNTTIVPGTIGYGPWLPTDPVIPFDLTGITISPQLTTEFVWRIEEKSDSVVMSVDVPGIDPKDIKVEVENHVLKVYGQRSDTKWPVSYTKSLSSNLDCRSAKAELHLGVLRVTLLKLEKNVYQVPVVVK